MRGKGGALHVFPIKAPLVSVTFRRIETLPPSKTATARMKDGEEKGEGWWWSASHSERPCGLFICCCLHRKWGCTEAPLTRSFYRRVRQRLQHSSEQRGSRTNLQTALQPVVMKKVGGKKQPTELRQASAGGLNVTLALINSSLGQTEVIQ